MAYIIIVLIILWIVNFKTLTLLGITNPLIVFLIEGIVDVIIPTVIILVIFKLKK